MKYSLSAVQSVHLHAAGGPAELRRDDVAVSYHGVGALAQGLYAVQLGAAYLDVLGIPERRAAFVGQLASRGS